MTYIVCGKFSLGGMPSPSRDNAGRKVRIGSLNPNRLTWVDYVPIATDGNCVLFDGATHGVRQFFARACKNRLQPLLVLTYREKYSVIEEALDYNLAIYVFEEMFPIFPATKYTSNLAQTVRTLRFRIAIVKSLDIKGGGINRYCSTIHQFHVERSIRYKNSMDRYFAFADMSSCQEVFKLKDERTERSILCLDYNAMFCDCMRGDFVEPKSIKKYDTSLDYDSDALKNGLYRVVLSEPKTDFIRNYHPFKRIIKGKKFAFQLKESDAVEALLFKSELEYYRNHFFKIRVIEGFGSEKNITHPLFGKANKLYRRRIKARRRGSDYHEAYYKLSMAMMHSCTNPLRQRVTAFQSEQELAKFISEEFFISKPKDMSYSEFFSEVSDDKYIKIKPAKQGYSAKTPDFRNDRAVFSLSAQVLANARIKMMALAEDLIKFEDLELCYMNVDSVHVSIMTRDMQRFLDIFSPRITEKMGGMKVQAIGTRGYWLGLGQYWIFDGHELVAYKNSATSHPGSKNPFIRTRKDFLRYRGSFMDFAAPRYRNVMDTFSYKKKVVKTACESCDNYQRYSLEEINNPEDAERRTYIERAKSKMTKARLFDEISRRRGAAGVD